MSTNKKTNHKGNQQKTNRNDMTQKTAKNAKTTRTAKTVETAKSAETVKTVKTTKPVPQYESFLYLLPEKVSAKELSEALSGIPAEAVEVWTEVNLLEITTEHATITFEDLAEQLNKQDEELVASVGMKQVYACDFESRDRAYVRKIMREFVDACGGKIGADSADFEPFTEPENI